MKNYETITTEIIQLFKKNPDNDKEVESFSTIVAEEDHRTLFLGVLPVFLEKMLDMEPEKGLLMFNKLIVNSAINNIVFQEKMLLKLTTEEKKEWARRFIEGMGDNFSEEQKTTYKSEFIDAITLTNLFSMERFNKEDLENQKNKGLLYYLNNKDLIKNGRKDAPSFLDVPANTDNKAEQHSLRALYSIFTSYHSEIKKEEAYKRIIENMRDTESYKFNNAFIERIHAAGTEKGLVFAEEIEKIFEKIGKPIKSYHEMYEYSVSNNLASQSEFLFHKEALQKYTESITPTKMNNSKKLS